MWLAFFLYPVISMLSISIHPLAHSPTHLPTHLHTHSSIHPSCPLSCGCPGRLKSRPVFARTMIWGVLGLENWPASSGWEQNETRSCFARGLLKGEIFHVQVRPLARQSESRIPLPDPCHATLSKPGFCFYIQTRLFLGWCSWDCSVSVMWICKAESLHSVGLSKVHS